MEHELIGWMMAMYFVKAIEQAEAMVAADTNWNFAGTETRELARHSPVPERTF
jgi:hypothetical protein